MIFSTKKVDKVELNTIWRNLVKILHTADNALEQLTIFTVPSALINFPIQVKEMDIYDEYDSDVDKDHLITVSPLHYLALNFGKAVKSSVVGQEKTALAFLHVAEFFIDHGADVNAVDENGDTPLIMAARHWSKGTLIWATALPWEKKNNHHLACANKMINLLLEKKADPNKADKRKITALSYCLIGLNQQEEWGQQDIALKLIYCGAEIDPLMVDEYMCNYNRQGPFLMVLLQREALQVKVNDLEQRLVKMQSMLDLTESKETVANEDDYKVSFFI